MTIRSSKFRHIYGDANVRSYNGVPVSKNAHEQDFCSVNPKFVAVVAEQIGGGAFFVLKTDRVGSVDAGTCKISKHVGAVYDVRWSPYNDNLIASACDDGLVRLWNITDERGVEPSHSPVQIMKGHNKRTGGLLWHPSAENVVASSSYDNTIRLWSVETAQQISTLESFTNQITGMSFSSDGTQIVATCKDKKLRVFNSHTGAIVVEGPGHENMKVSRCIYLKDGRIFTVGFSSMASRCCRIYDPRNMSKKVTELSIDNSTGSLFPYYDPDLSLIFIAGKGDANIRFYELDNVGDQIHYLNQYMSNDAQRGLGMMPKRGLNTGINEIARAYKLVVDKKLVSVIPLKVPRQSRTFAEDLYPDTVGYNAPLTAQDFIDGKVSEPELVPFLEIQSVPATSKGFSATVSEGPGPQPNMNGEDATAVSNLKKQVEELKKQLSEKSERISSLEAENAALKSKLDVVEDNKEKVKLKPPVPILPKVVQLSRMGYVQRMIAELQKNGIDCEE